LWTSNDEALTTQQSAPSTAERRRLIVVFAAAAAAADKTHPSTQVGYGVVRRQVTNVSSYWPPPAVT